MRPAMNILDHGWKHRAKEWKCGLSSDTTEDGTDGSDSQGLADDTKLTEDVEGPPTNQNPELTNQSESSRNRIPPGLKCDQKNAPDRIINGLGMFPHVSLVNYGVYPIIKQKVCERDLSREWIYTKTLL